MARKAKAKTIVSKTPYWDGYADTLSGRLPRERDGSYAKGVYVARRHLAEFHDKDPQGRSYAAAQADGMAAEEKNRALILNRAASVDEKIALVDADMENIRYCITSREQIPVVEKVKLHSLLLKLKKEQAQLRRKKIDLLRAVNCPCSKCEAWAVCSVLSLACKNFTKWVDSPRISSFPRLMPPSVEEFASLQTEI